MSIELPLAIGMALAFALTNGFHDAANAIATLVATRAARPGPAILMAAIFNMVGPLVFGAAVADTIARIVILPAGVTVPVVGAGLTGAVAWNTITWRRGIPSSSSHALVGGLVGATLSEVGPEGVRLGGIEGLHPIGVIGVLLALALSPPLGFAVSLVAERLALRTLRRATVRFVSPVRTAQWATAAWLAFSHGSNDAQKAIGVVAVLLLASGEADSLSAPIWVTLACAAMLTLGTALGGWSIVRTIGRRIFPLRPVDGLVSQASSAAVILAASGIGAPVSTTQIVSSSVVGIGGGRRRWRHVDWEVVREIALAWLTTIPAAGIIAALTLPLWRALG